jgi:uncharacterized RDD family membrane protein YckC
MPARRLLAFSVDWLVIVVWGAVLFGVVMIATAGNVPRPDSPWHAQGIGFLTMTVPVVLYFSASESSVARASVGKRVFGLIVSGATGGQLSFGTALLRNAIKFAPWECGHTVAHQAVFSGGETMATWVWAPAALALAGPVAWVVGIVVTERAPHDYLTGTRVARR